MTRLSDSLRGLADRAPVEGAGVSTSAATRRIYRGRRLRAAANATAGVGVVAVVALAAIHPGMGAPGSRTADAALPSAQMAGGKVAAPGNAASDAMSLAWGSCGTSPFNADVPAVSNKFSLALGEIGGEVKQGAIVTAALTVTRSADVASAYESPAANFIVLWNGIVVGTAQNSTLDPAVQSLSDGLGKEASQIDLVNCWDGTALPAGIYELAAYQDFYPLSTGIVPTAAPMPVPVGPTPVPVGATPSSVGTTVGPTVAPSSPIAVDGGVNTGDPGPAAVAPADRAVSNTVKFVVAGDAPKDPFGAYLSPATPAVAYPDDYLTPAAARDEYATRAANKTWDMAAGSQRVVKTGDSATANDPNAWTDSYYGCSADGTTVPAFPATSADWPLLSVDAKLPASVGISYGWVVNGNPEVNVSVKNISGHTLPGFWGQPNTTMYLVTDGKVVATSYLASTDPNGKSTSTSSDGLLAPDSNLSGTYLWRDVNGCFTGNSQATIKPGTYTVLMEQDVYVDNGNGGSGGPIAYVDGKRPVGNVGVGTSGVATTGGGTAVAPAPAEGLVPVPTTNTGPDLTPQTANADAPGLVAPNPADGNYDWLSLQVWTSLGKVTVK